MRGFVPAAHIFGVVYRFGLVRLESAHFVGVYFPRVDLPGESAVRAVVDFGLLALAVPENIFGD